MAQIAAILAAFIPAVAWLWFFWTRDRYEREPRRLIGKLFVWGVFSAPWALGLALFLARLERYVDAVGQAGAIPAAIALLFGFVFVKALNEEVMKYLVTANSTRTDPNFNEPVDGMIYMTTAALGFAAAENFLYIFGTYTGILAGAAEAGVAATEAAPVAALQAFGIVAPLRSLLSATGHVAMSGIVGYFLGQAVVGRRNGRWVLAGLLLAALLHAAFNFPPSLAQKLEAPTGFLSPAFGLTVLVWLVGIGLYVLLLRRALAQSPFRSRQLSARPAAPTPVPSAPEPAPPGQGTGSSGA
ncbi:MAG: PrsW family glutamic-type intramembrane protease [Armatimonadota bacterium]|nr:PrsW family glutamic-type intramembrane protease [Armatimonadota bacterium]MDR7449274.1 PrsW family glutamic-type intramembrane protease [Armatimonadota bacterium]MDR7459663.1 PrsW family glutamic-type intramembrane protease [Armatimonadota bacterium]MDR7480602.1 PrsW family glutamic-type intramembrane protease [Armatimonadota bacterium]MDR7488172.1 PrsW family glutamic-type intramembrane protease [Armatimonadota bacterium]